MIQRVQSLYLLLGVAALALMILAPVATLNIGSIGYTINALGTDSSAADFIDHDHAGGILFLGALALTMAVMLTNIFLFSNRKRQLVIGRLTYLLLAGVVVTMVWYINGFENDTDAGIEKRIGYFMPIAALAFNFLAIWSISKDEKLVRSVDRLR